MGALAALVVAGVAAGGLSAPTVSSAAPPSVAAASGPAAATVPAPSSSARPVATTTKRRPTTTTQTTKPVTTNVFGDEVDTRKCTNRIDYAEDPRSNAELNSVGVQTGRCPAPRRARTSAVAPGEAALAACVEQTGMTRTECIADAQAGNAN
jgi:hypothetical protein